MTDAIKSRFERNLDISEPDKEAVPRFQRLNRELDFVRDRILSGWRLKANREANRVWVGFNDDFSGRYPCFHTGLVALGEALQGNPLQSDIPGDCPKIDPIDQVLMSGATLTITRLGDGLQATWVRTLPSRTFEFEGNLHKVYRQGVRKAKGHKVVETSLAALQTSESITEGLLFR